MIIWFRRLVKRIKWSEAYSKVRMHARWEKLLKQLPPRKP